MVAETASGSTSTDATSGSSVTYTPSFTITDIQSTITASKGGTASFSITIYNNGQAPGQATVMVYDVDGNQVTSKTVYIDQGATSQVTVSFQSPSYVGIYTYIVKVKNDTKGTIDDSSAVTLAVSDTDSAKPNVMFLYESNAETKILLSYYKPSFEIAKLRLTLKDENGNSISQYDIDLSNHPNGTTQTYTVSMTNNLSSYTINNYVQSQLTVNANSTLKWQVPIRYFAIIPAGNHGLTVTNYPLGSNVVVKPYNEIDIQNSGSSNVTFNIYLIGIDDIKIVKLILEVQEIDINNEVYSTRTFYIEDVPPITLGQQSQTTTPTPTLTSTSTTELKAT